MVGQDTCELRLVLWLQQHFDRSGRQLRERRVGRGEHRERALARQGADEAGGLGRSDQGVEGAGLAGDVYDVARRRHHHCVNDVDHAVGALDVGRDDLCAGDGGLRHLVDGKRRTLSVQGDKAGLLQDHLGGHVAGNDVVGQDAGQRRQVLLLKQSRDRALRQLGECRVGWSEHRERALALEGVDEVGGA